MTFASRLLLTALLILPGLACGAPASDHPEAKLAALGLTLPTPAPVVANYVAAVRSGNLVFLAGQIPRSADGKVIVGKVPTTVSEEQAQAAARTCALQLLAALKTEIGDLAKVRRVVRVGGFIQSADTFTQQPKVLNGCSDLLVAVFGDRGRHARAAVGVNALPAGAVVEVEMVVEVAD
jgi:enamine deaminase RidA (YjgF/YER057c/UK114 family)